ncbi:MAG: hypothetical protein KAJ12_03905, partial [Bacteroidetes bacterium]|nr:hypothetical protein [Bacteroidota bacterium]
APFYRSQDLISILEPDTSSRKQGFDFLTPGSRMKDVKLGLEGPHQRTNAQLALAALEVLLRRRSVARRFSRITDRSIRAAFRNVKRNTGLAGRLQRAGKGNSVLLDVAHNPDGMRMLVRALGRRQGDRFTVVFGAMKDKDYSAMLSELAPITGLLIAVAPSSERALPPETIQREGERLGIRSAKASSVPMGVSRARRRGRVLVTGSHYVVGEALTYLKRKKA